MTSRHIKTIAAALSCASLLALHGCATVEMTEPGDAVSAGYQRAVSAVVEADVAAVELPGRDVTVNMSLLAWDDELPVGIDRYLESAIREKAARGGGGISADSTVTVKVFVFALGDMTTDRTLSLPLRNISLQVPLFYSARTDGMFDMVFVIEDREKGTRKVFTTRKGVNLSDAYLFRMFGPYDLGI